MESAPLIHKFWEMQFHSSMRICENSNVTRFFHRMERVSSGVDILHHAFLAEAGVDF